MSPLNSSSDPGAGTVHVAWVDAVPGSEGRLTAWMDGEHVPSELGTGRWRTVVRHQCDQDPTLSMLIYEDRHPEDFGIAPRVFRSRLGRRSIRTYFADTFREVARFGEVSASSVHLNAIVLQSTPGGAAALDAWYEAVHAPEILACPGWLGARRFHSMSDESRLLALYDLTDPHTPFSSPEYDEAVGWDELDGHITGYHGWRTYTRVGTSA